MAEKPSWVAYLALGISILTAGFSIFQWWNTEDETRINAAIEFSKTYYKARDMQTEGSIAKAYLGQPLSMQEMLLLTNQADYLNYVALLTSAHLVDQRFLAMDLQCSMIMMVHALENTAVAKMNMPKSFMKNLIEFAPHAKCDTKDFLDGFVAASKGKAAQ